MSEPMRVALVGATGLVGRSIVNECVGREDLRLGAIARREMALPRGARMEMFVADPARWGEVVESLKPQAVICAIGTTWAKAGRDEGAFRSVDHDLVLDFAGACRKLGVRRFVAVSSVGADAHSKGFYLRVKGETERDLAKLGFERLDILRPGLLRGRRDGDRRFAERAGIVLSPLINPFLGGRLRRYRAIDSQTVARAALYLAMRPVRGRFVHENAEILRAARHLPEPVAIPN
ncbi:NAD(P)H-binding protein [Porphyrobacter algicida]|uniref:NAD(P)H-binding protein n=2 Tax=Qipengyuania algicida TaxID=1836209 RepID=A0A845AER9_9SPHN|nr:NAD(P)H-binding protein [Qipengyuania algicida]